MTGLRNAGSEAAWNVVMVVVILAVAGAVGWGSLREGTGPWWERALGMLGSFLLVPVLFIGVITVLVGVAMLPGLLRERDDRRRMARLAELVEGRAAEARPGETDALVAWALDRKRGRLAAALDAWQALPALAAAEGPRRADLLRIVLRHAWALDGPKRLVRDGRRLLEGERLDEQDRARLERWSRQPDGEGARGVRPPPPAPLS